MRYLWTVDMDKTLIVLLNGNKTANEIAEYFNCCTSQVYTRCRNLGLSFRDRKESIEEYSKLKIEHLTKVSRPCLRCKELFDSEGMGNRICNDCKRLNAGYVGVVYG